MLNAFSLLHTLKQIKPGPIKKAALDIRQPGFLIYTQKFPSLPHNRLDRFIMPLNFNSYCYYMKKVKRMSNHQNELLLLFTSAYYDTLTNDIYYSELSYTGIKSFKKLADFFSELYFDR